MTFGCGTFSMRPGGLWVLIDMRVSVLYNVDKSMRLSVMYAYIRSNENLPYSPRL